MRKMMITACTTLGLYAGANAQSSSANHNVNLVLADAIQIAFTSGGPGVSINFNTVANYTNGVDADNAATLEVSSNTDYNVTVKAGAADFSSASATTMPVNNVLFVKEASQGSYVDLTITDQDLLTNQTRGTNSFNVSYRANPGFSYDSGTYTASVIYTATQL